MGTKPETTTFFLLLNIKIFYYQVKAFIGFFGRLVGCKPRFIKNILCGVLCLNLCFFSAVKSPKALPDAIIAIGVSPYSKSGICPDTGRYLFGL